MKERWRTKMKELHNLKELYLDEIRKINKKGELTPADGETAKKALEGLEKINCIMDDGDEYYGSADGYSGGRDRMGRYSYGMRSAMPDYYGADMYSGNRGMRYSRHSASDHAIEELEGLYSTEMDERKRRAIRNCIEELKMY